MRAAQRTDRLRRIAVAGVVLIAVLATGASVPPAPAGAEGNEAPGAPFFARSLAAGTFHTCALVNDGRVKCWGLNEFGELGLGDTVSRGDDVGEMGDLLPAVDLGTGRTATALSAGFGHTCALLDNATVKCWGGNGSGQLGYGDTADRGDDPGEMGDSLPAVNLGTGRTATAIAVGSSFSCALLDNSAVKCWGSGTVGQLGYGNTASRGDGPGEMGDSLPEVALGIANSATAITAGSSHVCVRLATAAVKCWGSNGSGQLGLGDTLHRGDGSGEMGDNLPTVLLGTGRTAASVTAGSAHTCALLDNGSVKCWGDGGSGRLGYGDGLPRGESPGEMGDSLPVVALGTGRTAATLAAGGQSTCALLDNGTARCWGRNNEGQLGYGDTISRGDGAGEMGDNLTPIALGTGRTPRTITVGNLHACALLDDRTVRCWGEGDDGRLGLGGTADRGDGAGEMGDSLPEVDLGSAARTATAVTAGGEHSCALLDNGQVKCWGRNNDGQLGYGDTASRSDVHGEMGDALRPVALGTGRSATALTAGADFTCAILDNATVKCWGENNAGQLGLGDTVDRGDGPGEMGDSLPAVDLGAGRTATAIDAGAAHVCARLDDATTKCWGSNTNGRLGLGDTNARGDAGGEMGNNLPAVDLGTGRTATSLAAGHAHTCARLDNATVKCWGLGTSGRLGYGDQTTRGSAAGQMGNNLSPVDLGAGQTVVEVASGSAHTCARLTTGAVKCWGLGTLGRLGYGDTLTRGSGAGEMGDALPAVDLAGTASMITAGESHTCARLDNAALRCWGSGADGRLGYGDTTTRGDNAGEMGNDLPSVSLGAGLFATAIDSHGLHSCARLDDGTVRCWGEGGDGRLAQGDTADRGDGPGEMGTALLRIDLGSAAPTGVSGTITDAVSGAPVAGALVAVLRTSDNAVAGGAFADGAGNFQALVPPGSYFLYLIDPVGAHTAAVATPTVTVISEQMADTDRTMAPTRGALSGTVSGPGNTPIGGAIAVALTTGGVVERAAVANGSGQYTVPGLAVGNHYLAYLDPAGSHSSRFHPNSSDLPSGTQLTVDAGGTTEANGALPAQSPVGTGAVISGTITDTASGAPLAGTLVLALRTSNFSMARAAVTNGSGVYSLDVAPGTYKLGFLDTTGAHTFEWHLNQPNTGLGTSTTVTAPQVVNNTLTLATGTMAGVVTDQSSGNPLAGAWAIAISPTGAISRGAVTAADGSYALSGLAPGSYRVTFVDPLGGRLQEFFDNSPTSLGATPVNVTANTTAGGIDAALAFP